MNQKFLCDFYRMTGKKYKRNIKSYLNIMFQHNVRYMYWWRKRNKKFIGKIARVFLFKYSRKYVLEIGNAKIEEGFYLGHPYNITINEESILGKNINIHKGATIGKENRGKKLGAPQIGNNVYIGVNSTVVGKIEIGNDVLIAPNTYVNFNVPSHSIVIGSPGVIIPNEKATEGYVNFCV